MVVGWEGAVVVVGAPGACGCAMVEVLFEWRNFERRIMKERTATSVFLSMSLQFDVSSCNRSFCLSMAVLIPPSS